MVDWSPQKIRDANIFNLISTVFYIRMAVVWVVACWINCIPLGIIAVFSLIFVHNTVLEKIFMHKYPEEHWQMGAKSRYL